MREACEEGGDEGRAEESCGDSREPCENVVEGREGEDDGSVDRNEGEEGVGAEGGKERSVGGCEDEDVKRGGEEKGKGREGKRIPLLDMGFTHQLSEGRGKVHLGRKERKIEK